MRTALLATLGVIVSCFVAVAVMSCSGDSKKALAWDEVIAAGRAGHLQSIEISGENLTVQLRNDEQRYTSRVENGTDIEKVLQHKGVQFGNGANSVEIKYKSPSSSDGE